MITAEKLHALKIAPQWVEPFNISFEKFQIVTLDEQAAFIGQTALECNHYTTMEEGLSYSAETLQKLFHTHFKPDEYAVFAHQPQKIANRVYASRYGNRDEASGDGWLYRGRGAIQNTFHDNYWHLSQALGEDFVRHPELLSTPNYALLSACWFWKTHGCNHFADAEDWEGLTRKVNGGLNGLDQRVNLTKHALIVLK